MKRQTHIHFVNLINKSSSDEEEEEEEEEEEREDIAPGPEPLRRRSGSDGDDDGREGREGARKEEGGEREGEKVMRLLANMTKNVMEAVAYFRHTGGMMETLLHNSQSLLDEQVIMLRGGRGWGGGGGGGER